MTTATAFTKLDVERELCRRYFPDARAATAIAIFYVSGLLAWVAVHARRFQRYGREALLCAAAWTFVVALMRCFSLAGWVSTDTVRSTNTVSAIVALVILTEIAWLRRVEHKNGVEA